MNNNASLVSNMSRRGFFSLAGAAALTASLSACAAGGGSSAASGTLKFWDMPWGPSAYAAEAEKLAKSFKGAGNVKYAWNGEMMNAASVVRLNNVIFRVGSYGYNRRLTVEGGYGGGTLMDPVVTRINQIRHLSEVPAFFDCAMYDAQPQNGTATTPAETPNDLRGELGPNAPDHWRFLLARHGRAINVGFADGSAKRVPLEETYLMRWSATWQRYELKLPPF